MPPGRGALYDLERKALQRQHVLELKALERRHYATHYQAGGLREYDSDATLPYTPDEDMPSSSTPSLKLVHTRGVSIPLRRSPRRHDTDLRRSKRIRTMHTYGA
jgi:hypothetical protein